MTAVRSSPRTRSARARVGGAALADRVRRIMGKLQSAIGSTKPELNHASALELLIATILSAQCTDQRVNQVTPALFKRYRTAAQYGQARRASWKR
jgi:endonuclease-3